MNIDAYCVQFTKTVLDKREWNVLPLMIKYTIINATGTIVPTTDLA